MIAILTPVRDTIQAETAFDLIQLIKYSPDTFFAISQGSILPNQRTSLVRKAIEAHASHILFIDSDMRFPKDGLEKLLKHAVAIVGINAKHRQGNKWTGGKLSRNKKGIEKIEAIGFGMTLIKTEVFFKIPEPWFATPYDGKQFVGEDIFFSRKAREAGFNIFIDHDLSKQIKHIGKVEF